MPEVTILAGTRPEGVRVAPLALAMAHDGRLSSRIVDTGQQPGRVADALHPFGIAPDVGLRPGRLSGTLAELVSTMTTAVDAELTGRRPAAVVVQGDTMTTLVGALVAFWQRIPVVHLDAGLRSHNLDHPFPEESNRAIVARVAALHLVSTAAAARHLVDEGVPTAQVVLTGSTAIDAMRRLLDAGLARPPSWLDRTRRLIVATAHRRENWGAGIAGICHALDRLTRQWSDSQVVFATHPNPALAGQIEAILGASPGVRVTPPLAYPEMLGLLSQADLAITDSGGLQEEAVTLGVPVLVTRVATERPEVLTSGLGHLVGTDPDQIVATAIRLLSNRLLSNRIGPVPLNRGPARVGMGRLGRSGAVPRLGLGPRPAAGARPGPAPRFGADRNSIPPLAVRPSPSADSLPGPPSPFGDGRAAPRAVAAIAQLLSLPTTPAPRPAVPR